MNLINKYIEIKFWQLLVLGGAIVSVITIVLMIIGFLLAIISDYGRLFAFSVSTFIAYIYLFALLLYFPIKFLLNLRRLKRSIH